ncbi:tetratricopeptide repeat protein [Paracidovorax konjaci]|uniref:Tetratricopeptide repeat-containing protein n=1 Tax=Paracidovorax konjaci TaxID=32040 RepID=A0A1I1RPJ2_9BURK|nr:tetratricopeptide repeat protein [Paracidovorax konjaci]SFD32450.1 Tetratricopeptide repeat-containing protein [Paracidovorax konjaci]
MATKPSASFVVFGLAVLAAVLAIYLPSWSHALLFDDLALTDGTIFANYGNLLAFKQRMLSYGSFVWVDSLAGAGWGKQRLFNVALHLATVAALYALVRELLARTRFPEEFEAQPHFGPSRSAAVRVGVALFAVNPMAVYAVAYLVQRSIVMATFFAVLACWCFVRGLSGRGAGWYAGAIVAYAAAVLSKEHAVMVAAMAVPLYIHVRRPGWRTIAGIAGVSAVLVAVAAAVLFGVYGDLLGKVFDQRSIDFTRQLERLSPGIGARMYPLSILNEAALFFAYGFLWFVPNVMWMSVDLRPAFPLGYAAFPQVLGLVGYVALWAAAVWAVLRRRGVLSLVGVALLFPLLLYVTEFATVWVQDPFVLYRSYLWAVAVPVLVAIVLTGFKPRTIYVLGSIVGLVFAMLAFERVASLSDDYTAWGDAAEKTDLKAPQNAVGRWRPFLNLGAYHLDRGSVTEAQKAFATAEALGALRGTARFNAGVALQQQKKHAEAIAAFDEAQKQGFDELQLYYHRGESEFALGLYPQAFEHFSQGLRLELPSVNAAEMDRIRQAMRLRRAESAIGANRFDDAIGGFTELLAASPNNPRLLLGLGMAHVGKGDTKAALALFDTMIARTPNAAAYYGRAMAYRGANQFAASLKDLDEAIRLDPRNPQYAQMRAQVAAARK